MPYLNLFPRISSLRNPSWRQPPSKVYVFVLHKKMFDWLKKRDESRLLPKSKEIWYDMEAYREIRSNSGYWREKAVWYFGKHLKPDALPLLIERLNDWVPQVRQAAATVIAQYIHSGYRRDWIMHAHDLRILERKTRSNHTLFLDALYEVLSKPEAAKDIEEGMASEDRTIRRFAYSMAFRNPAFDLESLLKRILQSGDIGLHKEVHLRLDSLSSELYEKIEPFGFTNRFSRTRTKFLEQSYRRQLPSLKSASTQMLLDRSASVRQTAMFFARKSGVDVGKAYRSILDSSANSKHQLWAVVALSEMGDESILPQLRAMLKCDEPRKIITALNGLERLNQPDADALLRQYLKCGHIQIVRHCSKAMVRRKTKLSTTELLELSRVSTEQNFLSSVVLRLNRIRSKWDRLNLLLKLLLATANRDVAQPIYIDLRRWFRSYNQNQHRLDESLRIEIRDTLAALEPNALHKRFYEELEFLTRA